MSIIGALLGWTKAPQWVLELILIGTLGGGLWWLHHHIYAQGIAAQQAADRRASAAVIADAAVATRAAQDAANRAEESYRDEVARNAAAAAAHPIGPVRLCIDAHVGGTGLPKAGGPVAGTPSASAAAGRIPGVPRRDSGLRPERRGPDVAALLGAWAQAADSVSARLRECQAR